MWHICYIFSLSLKPEVLKKVIVGQEMRLYETLSSHAGVLISP